MSDVRRLLEQATPLPWTSTHPQDIYGDTVRSSRGWLVAKTWPSGSKEGEGEQDNAALIVHAVNSLPAYEEAVDALDRLLDDTQHARHNCGDPECPVDRARAALSRLRGEK